MVHRPGAFARAIAVTPEPQDGRELVAELRYPQEAKRPSAALPLALTDEELATVLVLAAPIERARRDAFLHAVAVALASEPERGAGIVHRVRREIQRGFYDPPRMADYRDAHAHAPRQGYAYPSTRRT
jgi:hypothetical protein